MTADLRALTMVVRERRAYVAVAKKGTGETDSPPEGVGFRTVSPSLSE
jgi:hypothetical protein